VLKIRKGLATVGFIAAMLGGGAIGATAFGATGTGTATTTTTTSSSSGGSSVAPGGTFVSNENATHEAGESAAREAQENAGQFPTVP
jgi:hypothetical protein